MAVPTNNGVDRRRELLALIADGAVHSGADLAGQMGVSRTSVWHYAKGLGELGVTLQATRGNGYRLAVPVELLNETSIAAALPQQAREQLRHLQVLFVTDSTNQRLLELSEVGDVHGYACMAELQTAGRGRRGRRWVGGLGDGIFMSLAWRFRGAMESLAGLSLAAGVSLLRALQKQGAGDGLRLKWPNDLLHQQRKLAGVLIEVSGEMTGPCLAVIGVGINASMPGPMRVLVMQEPAAQPITDLSTVLGYMPSRDSIAAAVLGELILGMDEFSRSGFAAFSEAWMAHDALAGKAVTVQFGTEHTQGKACGVNSDGALLVEVNGEIKRVHTGEVSVRLQP